MALAAMRAASRTETEVVLKEFLPQAATEAEVNAAIDAAMAEVQAQGITGNPAMGKIMAILKPALAGRADMSALSALVKAKLG